MRTPTNPNAPQILQDILVVPGEQLHDCLCPGFEQWIIDTGEHGVALCTSHDGDCSIIAVDGRDLDDDHDHWSHRNNDGTLAPKAVQP